MQKSIYCLNQNRALELNQVILLIMYDEVDGGHFKDKT